MLVCRLIQFGFIYVLTDAIVMLFSNSSLLMQLNMLQLICLCLRFQGFSQCACWRTITDSFSTTVLFRIVYFLHGVPWSFACLLFSLICFYPFNYICPVFFLAIYVLSCCLLVCVKRWQIYKVKFRCKLQVRTWNENNIIVQAASCYMQCGNRFGVKVYIYLYFATWSSSLDLHVLNCLG